MSRIFISHSSANNAAALALAAWLETQGWSDYFLDVDERRGIDPGERWMAALAAAVDRCEAVIFLVSPAWRDSKYCFAEFYQAKNLGKRIFGVIVESVPLAQLPEQMTSEWQVCDLTAGEECVPFTVERAPVVPQTIVRLPRTGLEALARGLRKAGLAASTFLWPPAGDPGRSPYPGLRALQEDDAAVFFGRDAAIVRAIDQIRVVRERNVERLFVILGASGAGKSSFLRAGLLPRLRRDSEHYVVLPTMRPERAAISGSHGLLNCLQTALADAGQSLSQAELRTELASNGLGGLLRRSASSPEPLAVTGRAVERTVVMPVDQAEELFAADGLEEAQQFLQQLDALRREVTAGGSLPPGGRMRALLVMAIRSDSLPRLQGHAALQAMSPVLFSLPAMPATEFKAVIEGPARRHSEAVRPLVIAPGLTERLIADAQGADALPLLALTLEWLYREFSTAEGTRIGLDEYRGLGGVRGIIGKAVERALQQPADRPAIPTQRGEQEHLLQKVFPHIATVDPDTGEWKRRVALREALRQAAPQADALVSRLIEQRLLRADARRLDAAAEPVEVVEVAHEALLRQWETLERWLREYAANLSATESIRRAAADWERGGRDEALLVHTAHRLQAAESLLVDERLKGRFEQVDARYLSACRQRDQRRLDDREQQLKKIAEQQTARARLQWRASWALGAAALIMVGLAAWIVMQAREVGRQTSLVVASGSEVASDQGRSDQALRLGVLASRSSLLRPAHPKAKAALLRAVDRTTLVSVLYGTWLVGAAAFSPDGKRVVTASDVGRTARVWNVDTGKAGGALMGHGVRSASFSPDGGRVVTASDDGTARIWEAATGTPLGEPMSHDGSVFSASFSPDGERVVTASEDGTARVWDAVTGRSLGEPMMHGRPVDSARFSRDGSRVITRAGSDVSLWSAETSKLLFEPKKIDQRATSATFSPDGKRVVTASDEGTARIWETDTGAPVGEPMVHRQPITHIIFSPDGKRIVIVTTSTDSTVTDKAFGRGKIAYLWDADTGKRLGAQMKHDVALRQVRFSADGLRLATLSEDAKVRLWNAGTGQALSQPMTIGPLRSPYFFAFSDDLELIVSISSTGSVARIHRVEHGHPIGARMAHEGAVLPAGSSRRDLRLFEGTAPKGQGIRALDLEDRSITYSVLSASFSPVKRRVLTTSDDTTARLWDADTGTLLIGPMKHEGWVRSGAFSHDGKRVITASDDGTARTWDAETGRPVGKPMRHEGPVHFACFSPDGKRVVTASDDGTARIWDAETGRPLGRPMAHGGPVYFASFSPDGKRVVTASEDGTHRVWEVENGALLSGPALSPVTSTKTIAEKMDALAKSALDHTTHTDKSAGTESAATGSVIDELIENLQSLQESLDRLSKSKLAKFHQVGVHSAKFSPDGKRVVTASGDRTARIWETETGTPVGEPMRHDGPVSSANFSPDGKRVVTASDDGTARIWETETGKPVGEPMTHGGPITSAEFSANGRQIVTASTDNTARIWDGETGRPVSEPRTHGGWVLSARFNHDGTQIVTASADGTARVWGGYWPLIGDADALIAIACEKIDITDRRITSDDLRAGRVISPERIREDACEGRTPFSFEEIRLISKEESQRVS